MWMSVDKNKKKFERKYVYLFELDSVRKTDEEIVIAQRALYDEIVTNGNVVVMTFNQLVDSRGFISLLLDEKYKDSLVKLFENGAIRISQFGNLRTVAHYMLNAVEDYENEFLYSALPVRYEQKRLTALVYRSLKYCDLTEIHNYNSISADEREIRDLFIEVHKEKDKSGKIVDVVKESSIPVNEMRDILLLIEKLLGLIMRISSVTNIYISPREKSTYRNLCFLDILNIVKKFDAPEMPLAPDVPGASLSVTLSEALSATLIETLSVTWKPACELISSLKCYKNGIQNRSKYIREILDYVADNPAEKQVCQCAEIILDLCYNYASEISINNVSKHYDVSELTTENSDMPTFKADFWHRFAQLWDDGRNSDNKFLQPETNDFVAFKFDNAAIPDFEEAVRVSEYLNFKGEVDGPTIPRYEYKIKEQRVQVNKGVALKLGKQLLSIVLSLIIILILALVGEAVENIVGGDISFLLSADDILMFAFYVLMFLIVDEIITHFLSRKFPNLLSLSEAISGIKQIITDTFKVIFLEGQPYSNAPIETSSKTEDFLQSKPIDLYESVNLARYRKWSKAPLNERHMKPMKEYPIADINKPEVIRNLMRLEELHNYKFGISYKSKYSTMVVDPIVDGSSFYPYERQTSTSGVDGVVTVPVYDGKFILIEQYRHAIRTKQIGFPRGFAEHGGSGEAVARRELEEELGGVVKKGTKPVKIGEITSDSGASTGLIGIYKVELESFNPSVGHEGIVRCLMLTKEELQAKIRSGEITDGFTLSSFAIFNELDRG